MIERQQIDERAEVDVLLSLAVRSVRQQLHLIVKARIVAEYRVAALACAAVCRSVNLIPPLR